MPEEPQVPGLVVTRPSRRRRVRKFFLWGLIALLLYTLIGFLVLPPILKRVASRQLTELLHRETTIQNVRVNPFTLTLRIQGFSMKNRSTSDPFIAFEDLFIDLEAISLVKGGPVLREIRLTAPHISVIRNEDMTYNFSDLLQQFSEKPAAAPPKKPPAPLHFSLNNIQILGGRIDFADHPKHAQHVVTDLTLAIPFVSNLPYYLDVFVQPAFQAKFNGTLVALAGKTKPFTDSLETTLDINVNHFELPKYLEYVPVEMRFKFLSGDLDTKLSLSFIQYRDKAPALVVHGLLTLNTLSLQHLNSAPLLDVPLLSVAIDSADVFAKKVVLASILVQSPRVSVRREKSGSLSIMSILPPEKAADAAPIENKANAPPSETKAAAPDAPRLQLQAEEVRLADGTIHFTDEATDKPFRTTVQSVNVTVKHVTNIPKQPPAELEVSLQTDAGETVKHTGTFSLEPLAADGMIELEKIPVQRYAPYYGRYLLFEVENGILSASTRYHYARDPGETALAGLTLSTAAVRLKRKGEKEEFLKIPAFSVKNGAIDLTKQSIVIGEVSTKKGAVLVRREADGAINLGKLVPASKPVGDQAASPAAKKTPASPPKKEAPAAPWLFTLTRLVVDRYAVTVEDHVPSEPTKFTADPVNITAENLTTAKDRKGKVSVRLTLNNSTQFVAGGTVGLTPVAANLTLDLSNLELIPLQPYFANRINVVVTNGALSTHGALIAAERPDKTLAVSFTGDVSLIKFATIDKAHSQDLLNWASLTVTGINAGNDPLHIEIKEIALTDFYSRLIVNPDGTLNVQGLAVSEPKVPEKTGTEAAPASEPVVATAAEQPAPASIRIETVTLQGGNVSFSDRFIKPNYSAELTQLAGRISGLSSEESQRAEVDIRGQLGSGAPLQIVGKTNPLGKELFVDLRVDFKDIDLSPMTVYSGKYAGYTIEKGKLSLQLKYLIENRKLSAENKVFMDQFTLGDKVDSPDATKLPVSLAVSLLKDRNGEIHLDVPVSGSLDDPKFSVWSVVLQVITNLLSKAATAPFALVASLVGGGPELSYVEFDYGSSRVEGSAEDKLQKLGKILYDRPAVKLEVSGRTDPEKDTEMVQKRQFERKLKAQKLNETVKKSGATGSVDDVKIESNEYDKYLTLAYKKETFPKPKNMLGFAKDLPPADMKNLILSHIVVTEEDLRQLASQRAQAVMDFLTQSAKIEPGRIFLMSAAAPAQDAKDTKKRSRVDFVIR